ncbi:uncharacterized protein EKO05_0007572 [Ascochyta rabiei]|uniref:uncharacterized protein n=1 Tax=Didymella rabiei TaxID=5454 RepID=UPI002200C684|nr:uncharacterized protein EKO05_0007572 [Ascochyta rabiei]UPX17203.1 hypothetical protein EKO05_0007572 [Ascochyta rabiei]
MARLRRCLFVALSLIGPSYQKDPIVDFCRRWAHQTAQVDGRLYIDGGMVDWNPESMNYTNTWLLFSDLNASTLGLGQPPQYANLSKPSDIPSVSGGILWPDEANKCFYQFGGEFTAGLPSEFSMHTYDVVLDQWNLTGNKAAGVFTTQRAAYGGGTHIEGLGLGFYLGGWMSNQTSPDWTGPAVATADLIRFEYSTGLLYNTSGPEDNVGRAEGQMVYLPVSDSGVLVYFGGIEDQHQNGTAAPANMSNIHIYDVASSKWYTQTASGSIPEARRQFCAGVTWADDQSSYNVYLYGGHGFGDSPGFDDAYILTIPSFTWIKVFPTANNTAEYPHGGCSANVVTRDQMLIIGGWFPESDQCDSPQIQGQHLMNLGFNGEKQALWDKYDPSLSTYSVPTPVISAIGGGPTGGATVTAPVSWDNPDLAVYYSLKAPSVSRTATRILPSRSGTSSPQGSNKVKVGAIAGGIVGGLAALIAILSLILFCLHRRKKTEKRKDGQVFELPAPVELGVTTPAQEMPAYNMGKYIPLDQQQEHTSLYSGATLPHSPHSLYAQQSTTSASPPHSTPYGSPHNASYAQPAYPPNTHSRSPNWEQAQYSSTVDSWHSQQGQFSPALASHLPYAPPQEAQLYYPPPREPTYHATTSHPAGDGNRTLVQHDDKASPSPQPISTMPTPTQFYAQPVPVDGQAKPGYVQALPNEGMYGDSLEPQRRPKYGRFVEVDHT